MAGLVNKGRFLQELAPMLFQLEALSPAIIKGEETASKHVKEFIKTVTIANLEYLPTVSECQQSECPILVADIMLSKGKINVNAFGFRKAGDKMALHDHPKIRGFIKCLRGSMKVRSFTTIAENKAKDEVECRYEGEIMANTSSECLVLTPNKGNIHEIMALEDGTFFFDALFPGYQHDDDCTYFSETKPVTEPGSTTILKKLKHAPEWQEMAAWYFPQL